MGYLPIFLEVRGRPCLVVGGGETAERKARALIEAEAEVTIVSPSFREGIASIHVRYLARAYEQGDMRGFALVYAASDDPDLNQRLAAEARELGIPINVVDKRDPDEWLPTKEKK